MVSNQNRDALIIDPGSDENVIANFIKNINKNALNEVLSRNAIPNVGSLNEVSNTIDWLINTESSAITGQSIYLGGA